MFKKVISTTLLVVAVGVITLIVASQWFPDQTEAQESSINPVEADTAQMSPAFQAVLDEWQQTNGNRSSLSFQNHQGHIITLECFFRKLVNSG